MRRRVGALLVGLALAACATAAIPQQPPTSTTATAEAVATTTPSTTVAVARASGPVAAMGFTAGEPVDVDLPDLGAPALVATCTPEQWFPEWRAWEVVSSNQVPVQATLVGGSGTSITFSAAPGTTWLLAPAEDGPNPASLVFAGSTVASVDEAGPVCQSEDPGPQLPTIVQGCRLGGDVTAWTVQSGDRAVVATMETPGGSLTGTASGGSVWYLPSGSARLVVGGEVIARADPADCPDPASGLKSLESACATVDGATERWWRVGNGTAAGVSVRLSGAGTVEGVAAPGDSWWFMAPGPDGTVSLSVRDEVFVDSTAGSICGQPPPTTVPPVTTTVPPTTVPPTTTTESPTTTTAPPTTTTEPPTTTTAPPTTTTEPPTTTTMPATTTTTRPPITTTRPPTTTTRPPTTTTRPPTTTTRPPTTTSSGPTTTSLLVTTTTTTPATTSSTVVEVAPPTVASSTTEPSTTTTRPDRTTTTERRTTTSSVPPTTLAAPPTTEPGPAGGGFGTVALGLLGATATAALIAGGVTLYRRRGE